MMSPALNSLQLWWGFYCRELANVSLRACQEQTSGRPCSGVPIASGSQLGAFPTFFLEVGLLLSPLSACLIAAILIKQPPLPPQLWLFTN